MKVAVFSESEADEAAVRILVNALLGGSTEPADLSPRSRGWPSVVQLLPAVIKKCHYHSDTEALVVVVDSDDSVVHDEGHESPSEASEECRLCLLRQVVAEVTGQLRPVATKTPLKVALGLAVPAIEAWYRCGVDPHVSETTWANAQKEGLFPYSRPGLKRDVYGTDRPSLAFETRRATEEALRLADSLEVLIRLFPNGFGRLAKEVVSWESEQTSADSATQ